MTEGLRARIVVVKSRGGIYDDQSFIAGYQLGSIHERLLAAKNFRLEMPIEVVARPLVTQLDITAMALGYRVVVHEWAEGQVPDEIRARAVPVSFEWVEPEIDPPKA